MNSAFLRRTCWWQVVYFHDPDSKMTLLLHDPHTMTRAELPGHGHANFDAFFRAHDDEDPALADSNAFWVVEHENAASGGPVLVGGEEPAKIRLRHLNSGRYLFMTDDLRMHKLASKIIISHMMGKPVLPKKKLKKGKSFRGPINPGAPGGGSPDGSGLRPHTPYLVAGGAGPASGNEAGPAEAGKAVAEKPEKKPEKRLVLHSMRDSAPKTIGTCQDPSTGASLFTPLFHRSGQPGGAAPEAARLASNVALHLDCGGRFVKISKPAELALMGGHHDERPVLPEHHHEHHHHHHGKDHREGEEGGGASDGDESYDTDGGSNDGDDGLEQVGLRLTMG